MPNWNIHIEVGKQVAKNLKYSEEDKELFLLGNLLPDINNGFLVKEVSKFISHADTHLHSETIPTYENFYNKYKDNINSDPIFLGAFVHLYTDHIWNNYFREKCNNSEKMSKLSGGKQRKIKRSEFKKYSSQFVDNNIIRIDDYEKVLDRIKIFEEVSIEKDDLIKVNRYFLNQKPMKNLELEFYTMDEFDLLFKKTIKDNINIINKLIHK